MQTSKDITNLMVAMGKFHEEMPPLVKDATGYGYKYVTLDAMLETVLPIMRKHSLIPVQVPGFAGGNLVLTTRITHTKSGEWLQDAMPVATSGLKGGSEAQQAGSGITYARRYALAAILMLSTEDDNDATPARKASSSQKESLEKYGDVVNRVLEAKEWSWDELTYRQAASLLKYLKKEQQRN